MAVSSTASWNPDIGDIIEEAFELCGKESRSGQDMRTARRSINYLLLEWANEGYNLWTIDSVTIPSSTVVAGTASYEIEQDTISIIDMVTRLNDGDTALQSDVILQRISTPTYLAIPSKLQSGRPVQWALNRDAVLESGPGDVDDASTFVVWPVPDETDKYTIVYWRLRRMADAGTTADVTMDIPERFQPAFVYGLALRLAIKMAPSRVPMLKQEYNDLFRKAMEEDREKTSLRMVPDLTGY